MPEWFGNIKVDNKFALAFAICLVFAQLIVKMLRHVPRRRIPHFVDRVLWMVLGVVIVAVVMANVPEILFGSAQHSQRFEITGRIEDENGKFLNLSDASVTLGNSVPGCGALGAAAKVTRAEFKFSCAKDPGELTVGVRIRKPGFPMQDGYISSHRDNVLLMRRSE